MKLIDTWIVNKQTFEELHALKETHSQNGFPKQRDFLIFLLGALEGRDFSQKEGRRQAIFDL